MENIINDLDKIFWDKLKEEEGITKKDLDMVDLDIEFSPVTPFKDGQPCEVTKATGKGLYIVPGAIPPTVSEAMLKVMRYRYLKNRRNPFENLFK